MIESRNFTSETHFITTSDGYILQVFRIINPFLNNNKTQKTIILQHGFLAHSDEFLISRKGYIREDGVYIEEDHIITDCVNNTKFGKTLGFVLSACGYDVWLSNVRGNKYTTNHTSLNAKDRHFWKFSLDEYSLIDLPAIIDYIRAQTHEERLGFIGYSMGTTIMFALMSAQPSYASIIDPFVAIAPVVYLSKVPKLFLMFRNLYPLFRAIPGPIFGSHFLRKFIVEIFGKEELPNQDPFVIEIAAHLIQESSTLVLSHFLQIMAKDTFGRYDWGPLENFIRYFSFSPPKYPLADITSNRIALIQSKSNDNFSDFKDISRLKSELKIKPILDFWIPDQNWTHSDYLFNENVDKYLISVVIHLLKS